MALSLTQTATVRITAGQAITNNLLRLLALSPSVSISGSVGAADLAAGAVTAAKSTPGAYWFGTTSGGTTAYTLTLNPALGALADGVTVNFKCNATCTGPSTLNVNGLGAVNLMRNGKALFPGELLANEVYQAMYNSTGPAWEILSPLGVPDSLFEAVTNTGNAYTWTSSNSPAVASLSALRGAVLTFRASTNTGATTLNVDGLGAKAVVYPDQTALAGGEFRDGTLAAVTYSSVIDKFVLLSPSGNPRPAIVAACRNLELRSTSTTAATLTADEVVLKSTAGTGVARLFSSVSTSVDITLGVALNAFETGGSRTTSRWYYVWLISDGTNLRTVLEDSGSADGAVPAGPDLSGGAFTGYVWQGLVGQIRLNATGSGEIVAFHQRDRRVWFHDTNVFDTGTAGTSPTTYTVLAGGNLTAFRAAVPPNAVSCTGAMGSASTADNCSFSIAGCANDGTADTTNFLGAQHVVINQLGAEYENFAGSAVVADIPVRGGASRNVQWKAAAAGNDVRLNLSQYTF